MSAPSAAVAVAVAAVRWAAASARSSCSSVRCSSASTSARSSTARAAGAGAARSRRTRSASAPPSRRTPSASAVSCATVDVARHLLGRGAARGRRPVRPARGRELRGPGGHGVRRRDQRHRAVLLPARPDDLPRPRLLRRAAEPVRRVRRAARRDLRARARVRAPHRADHRRHGVRRPQRQRAGVRLGAGRAAWRTASPGCGSGTRRRWSTPTPASPTSSRPTEQELDDALSAASAVGDDRIQEAVDRQVDPHTWTHGSSEQRQRWFLQGYQNGSFQGCDALNAPQL